MYDVDAQVNYGPDDFLAEYVWLYPNPSTSGAILLTKDRFYVLKSTWNFGIMGEQILQLTLMQIATTPDKAFRPQSIKPYTSVVFHSEWSAVVGSHKYAFFNVSISQNTRETSLT